MAEFRDRTSPYWRRDFVQTVWYDDFAFAVPPGKRWIAPSRLSHSAFPKKAEETLCVF